MSKKWSYEAIRTVDGVNAFVVVQNGDEVTNRTPLPHIVKHSPTGFEKGYGGSGPADLAFSILTHWFMSYKFTKAEAMKEAGKHYQNFKWSFIATSCNKRFCISDSVIEDWWVEQEEERERLLGEKGARH